MSADPCGCGCCEVPLPPVPQPIFNVPGLPAVEYRIGTYAAFRAALVERMATKQALRALTTRDASDYAIALLDSWAYVAEILTFYGERAINESLLRTARLRESIGLLAAMVGYDPSPGLAATATLAFELDAGARFALAAGARVQSVPAAGQNAPPVKFETLAALAADAALNSVPLAAPPVADTPLAAGRSEGFVAPGKALPDGVVEGATLLAWSPGSGVVERKRVESVSEAGPAGTLRWAPPLHAARTTLTVWQRTLRIFGHDAPESFLGTDPQAPPNPPRVKQLKAPAGGTLGGVTIPYDFTVPAGTSLDLERELPDLALGARLLVPNPSGGTTVSTTVTAITRAPVRFGPLEATTTRVTLSVPIPKLPDRRAVELYEAGPDIALWDHAAPAAIAGGLVYAPLAVAPEHDRAVVLQDSGAATATRIVSAVAAPDLPGHLAITVSPPPAAPLATASAFLLGNVVRASHGEQVTAELLGRGDARVAFQRLPLAKPPLTRIPSPGAPHGGASTLVVRVDGVQWHERERLYSAGPDDRVFVVAVDDDGRHHVCFGDGVQGARLPTGSQVHADYRTGLGAAGNVATGALRSPLTRPKGLKGVINPLPAGGGADPETAEQARANAPNTVRTFGRIVSLQDAEDQARSSALVAKASAAWIRVGPDLGVGLTVAGPDGALLTGAQLDDLRADLDARRDPNQRLVVRGHRSLALAAGAHVLAIDPDYEAETVRAAVAAALLAHFAFAPRQFGQPVRLSEAIVSAQGAAGVLGIDIEHLTLADPAEVAAHGLSAAPVQDRIDLAPDELATLAVADLVVTGP